MESIIKQIENQIKQKKEKIKQTKVDLQILEEELSELEQSIVILRGNKKPEEEKVSTTEDSTTDKAIERIVAESSKKEKWYVIFNGPFKGIYNNWAIANQHIRGKPVTHKSYPTKEEAEKAFSEAYKVMVQENAVLAIKDEKKKTILKSESIKLIQNIPTTKQHLERKQISITKFEQLWDSVVNYTELHTTMGFYPKRRDPYAGPKVILLPTAEPMIAYEYFVHGFTDTIYFDNLSIFREFPLKMQTTIKEYKERFAKDRCLFLRTHCSFPLFTEEGEVLVSSFSVSMIGISNETYPTNDKEEIPVNMLPSYEIYGREIAKVYMASRRIDSHPLQKNGFRLNYYSPTSIIYSKDSQPMKEEAKKLLLKFEDKFEVMDKQLDKLPNEITLVICASLGNYESHLKRCPYCIKKTEETIQMEDSCEDISYQHA